MWWLSLFTLVSAQQSNPLFQVLSIISGADNIPAQEWNKMTFVQRVLAYDWRKEGIMFASIVVYLIVYFWGRNKNKNQVDKWLQAALPVLKDQFAQVGVTKDQLLLKESAAKYVTYASGRLNIESVLVKFTAVDRHNMLLSILGLISPSLRSAEGLDDAVEVTITPHDRNAIHPFIFGVIHKDVMQESREQNYYLSLTNTVDSEILPRELTFMHEHNEMPKSLPPSLLEALGAATGVLRMFVVTDQPAKAPKKIEDLSPHPVIRLSFSYPRSETDQNNVRRILSAAIDLADYLLETPNVFSSHVIRKVRTTREQEIAKLRKEEQSRLKEEAEQKKGEERREKLRQQAQLSEKEQRKLAKKEQSKRARKERGRNSVRA